jgi:hypothetical protein
MAPSRFGHNSHVLEKLKQDNFEIRWEDLQLSDTIIGKGSSSILLSSASLFPSVVLTFSSTGGSGIVKKGVWLTTEVVRCLLSFFSFFFLFFFFSFPPRLLTSGVVLQAVKQLNAGEFADEDELLQFYKEIEVLRSFIPKNKNQVFFFLAFLFFSLSL